MKPKAKTADPSRNHRISILVNEEELARIDEHARLEGLSRSDVLRRPYAPSAAPTGTRRDA